MIIIAMMIFYIIFVAYSDINQFSLNFSNFNLYYVPVILFLIFTFLFIQGFRQHILLKKISVDISIKDNLLIFFSGLSMVITPAGSGGIIKSYFLKKKHGYALTKTFPLTFIEKFHDLLAITTIISFFSLFTELDILSLILTISIVLVVIFTIVRTKKLFYFVTKLLSRIPKLKKLTPRLNESYESSYLLTSKNVTITSWSISLLAWSIHVVAIYLTFIAFGLNFDIVYTTVVTLSSILLGSMSFLPAGVGFTELSFVGFMTKSGIQLSVATSVIIMIRLLGIWFATLLGFITTKYFFSK